MDSYAKLIEELRRVCPDMELRERENMKNHTSFRVGGPVRLMALPGNEREAVETVRTALTLGIKPLFMGNGSNLLVADAGVEAFILKCDKLNTLEQTGEGEITAGSGVSLARLANFACERGLTGLEFAHGIPGTVGGAVTMNAGAYDGEMKQVIVRTRYLTEAGEYARAEGAEQDFAYRHSAFSGGERLILSATARLAPGDPKTIKARMDTLMEKRRSKQPLDLPSGGSTFKRPEGYFAAALIEQCGLKGKGVGGARVSEKHAGFVVNGGDATCADVLSVVNLVKETVHQETGVTLELEIKTLGIS